MTDVTLDILDDENAVLRVTEANGEVRFVPVEITDTTPMGVTPLLGKVDEDFMPQELLDTLFRMRLKTNEERWWQDYFITRRDCREQYAEAIATADEEFRIEAQKHLSI